MNCWLTKQKNQVSCVTNAFLALIGALIVDLNKYDLDMLLRKVLWIFIHRRLMDWDGEMYKLDVVD